MELCKLTTLFSMIITRILTSENAVCYDFEFSKIKIKAQQNQLKNLTQSIVNRLEQTSPLEIKLEEWNLG